MKWLGMITWLLFVQFSVAQPICSSSEHLSIVKQSKELEAQKHFALLYVKTNEIMDQNLLDFDFQTAIFINRFSIPFMSYFIRACDSFQSHGKIPIAWQTYFSDTLSNPLLYWMLGMNAHICGDMPFALSATFTLEELKQYHRSFIKMNSTFDILIRNTIKQGVEMNVGIKKWHRRSLGLDAIIMKHKVHRWRRKAYKMAIKLAKNKKEIEQWIFNKCNLHNRKLIRLTFRVWE
jgi:hypothetical protein